MTQYLNMHRNILTRSYFYSEKKMSLKQMHFTRNNLAFKFLSIILEFAVQNQVHFVDVLMAVMIFAAAEVFVVARNLYKKKKRN